MVDSIAYLTFITLLLLMLGVNVHASLPKGALYVLGPDITKTYAATYVFTMMASGCLTLYMFDAVGSGEFSAIPFTASKEIWVSDEDREFYIQILKAIYCLWIFVLPANIYAAGQKLKSKDWPMMPYAANFLLGLVLSRPGNIFHDVLSIFKSSY